MPRPIRFRRSRWNRHSMILVIALVKPFRAPMVLRALEDSSALSITVREVKGFGRQKERLGLYLGSEYADAFLPKVEIAIALPDASTLEETIRTIVTHSRTGRMGDGKILVLRSDAPAVIWRGE